MYFLFKHFFISLLFFLTVTTQKICLQCLLFSLLLDLICCWYYKVSIWPWELFIPSMTYFLPLSDPVQPSLFQLTVGVFFILSLIFLCWEQSFLGIIIFLIICDDILVWLSFDNALGCITQFWVWLIADSLIISKANLPPCFFLCITMTYYRDRPLGHWATGIFILLPPQHKGYKHTSPFTGFYTLYIGMRNRSQILLIVQQTLYRLWYIPCPWHMIFKNVTTMQTISFHYDIFKHKLSLLILIPFSSCYSYH